MELELDGDSELEVLGNIEVTLPSYMTILEQVDLERASRSANKERIVIAAGRKLDSNEIILVTADNRFFSLDAIKHDFPHGVVRPTHGGHIVFIENENMICTTSAFRALQLATAINVALLA